MKLYGYGIIQVSSNYITGRNQMLFHMLTCNDRHIVVSWITEETCICGQVETIEREDAEMPIRTSGMGGILVRSVELRAYGVARAW